MSRDRLLFSVLVLRFAAEEQNKMNKKKKEGWQKTQTV